MTLLPLQTVQDFSNHVTLTSWDDWVPQDRVRKFTDENKELAAQLHTQMKLLQQKAPKSSAKAKAGRANGSDFGSSGRGSEERHASVAAAGGGRGPRRNRDYDLEQVSFSFTFCSVSFVLYSSCARLCLVLALWISGLGKLRRSTP